MNPHTYNDSPDGNSAARLDIHDDLDELSELGDIPADNALRLELVPFHLERLEDYELGGHHPVQLGDVLGNDRRYTVLHKLGHGGFANVWLCRDTHVQPQATYIALKILMADASVQECSELRAMQLESWRDKDRAAEYVCLPLDKFNFDGPNGAHYCFVYPVLGPRASLGLYCDSEDPDRVLRSICLKATEAMSFLHAHKICHGGKFTPNSDFKRSLQKLIVSILDFTPKNVLHRISGLDGLPEDEALGILGKPRLNKVYDSNKSETGTHDNPSAPQHLVYPINWHTVDSKYISSDPCIIDLGESFIASDPPEELGTPGPYRSPELILDQKAGYGSDLWALGCSIFEIRTGRKLFDVFDDEDDAYLDAMVQVLGVMPEPWWSATWVGRKKVYEDRADDFGRAVFVGNEARHHVGGVESRVHPSVAEGARSLMEKLAPGLWYLSDESGGNGVHRVITLKERELMSDLLSKLLAWAPETRSSAKDAAQHAWLRS